MKQGSKFILFLAAFCLCQESAEAQTNSYYKPETNSYYNKPTSNYSNPNSNRTDIRIPNRSESRGKTRGHYFGLSANANQLTFHEEHTQLPSPDSQENRPSSSGAGFGAGLEYKYAVNFNDFFIAPGLLVERYNNSVKGSEKIGDHGNNGEKTRIDARYRYGITGNFGYDFDQYFSPYLMGGYAVTGFRTENGLSTSVTYYESILGNAKSGSAVLGAGFNFRINDQVSLNFEANTQRFKVKTNTSVPLNTSGIDYKAHFVGRFNVIKLGVMYNF